jgi:disulfide bond formation protein DsbB
MHHVTISFMGYFLGSILLAVVVLFVVGILYRKKKLAVISGFLFLAGAIAAGYISLRQYEEAMQQVVPQPEEPYEDGR